MFMCIWEYVQVHMGSNCLSVYGSMSKCTWDLSVFECIWEYVQVHMGFKFECIWEYVQVHMRVCLTAYMGACPSAHESVSAYRNMSKCKWEYA